MDILGIGPLEVILVLVLAMIFLGPGKMPEVARSIGKAVREFQRASHEMTDALNAELAEIDQQKQEVLAAVDQIDQPGVERQGLTTPAVTAQIDQPEDEQQRLPALAEGEQVDQAEVEQHRLPALADIDQVDEPCGEQPQPSIQNESHVIDLPEPEVTAQAQVEEVAEAEKENVEVVALLPAPKPTEPTANGRNGRKGHSNGKHRSSTAALKEAVRLAEVSVATGGEEDENADLLLGENS